MNIINHVLQTTQPYRITSPFGMRNLVIGGRTIRHMHNGIDLVPRAPIIAIARGKVIRVTKDMLESRSQEIIANRLMHLSYGNFVELEHANGQRSLYAHLRSSSVPENIKVGAIVEKGAVLGQMGTTGHSTGVHLHFEIIEGTKKVNPLPYLLGEKQVHDFVDAIVTRDNVPTLTVNIATLRFRKTPNGELLGTFPQGAKPLYLGKTPLINGYEWAEIVYKNQIVYCALNQEWNEVVLPVKEVEKIVVKEVVKEVVKPLDETIEKNGMKVRVVIS